MLSKIMSIPKAKYFDYFILIIRVLLAWTFISYGWEKLMDGQFGLSQEEMIKPIKDLSLFRVSWYLFDHQPFKLFIGISQLICGILLLINRTVIIGAFMFLPIVINILVIDLTFMPPSLKQGFAWRLSFYIFFDLLIIWHYRDKIIKAFRLIYNDISTKFKFPLWAYLILPLLAILLEIVSAFPKIFYNLITKPEQTIETLKSIPEYFIELVEKLIG